MSVYKKSLQISASVVISTLVLTGLSFPALRQTQNKQLEDALVEIAKLKSVITEQDRRITELEKAVSILQSLVGQLNISPSQYQDAGARPALQRTTSGWRIKSNWLRVKDGMSRAQVIAILGEPTSEKSLDTFLTMFYQGQVPGSGSVSGNVELHNDRVYQINVPVF